MIVAGLSGPMRSFALSPLTETELIFGPVSSASMSAAVGKLVSSSPETKPVPMVKVSVTPSTPVFPPTPETDSMGASWAKVILSAKLPSRVTLVIFDRLFASAIF